MKNLTKLAAGIALVSSAAFTTSVMADVSANLALASDYFYRGIDQGASATASGGIDFEQGGFYLGTWTADVSDGLEIDVYGGYTQEFEGGFSLGIGVTGYYYTGGFDETYEEINLTAGFGIVSLEYSVGTYDSEPETDYDFFAVTVESNGFYGTYGTFGKDFDGDYLELGYGTEVGGFDVGVAAIFSSDELSNTEEVIGTDVFGEDITKAISDESFVFTISKSFDL